MRGVQHAIQSWLTQDPLPFGRLLTDLAATCALDCRYTLSWARITPECTHAFGVMRF